ncbi:cysteine synthase A [Prosthecochloris sp. N3]|uniref:cysteine synthase n=1 Tax=Prosthecochloris ethylica TaxID=2743976 RepID=A0ABR9XNV6_9CHLB|nr:cysteine synthase A [Prosthecochloris ethylica]MBF0585811.1 cysteine synthase A [Prosthecochloris ethylica]MBF0635721.1 cysteine synthase A [Prosthecochloris ethylica]NUK47019.1 cysteine synthase A [Prosthecochloris ethylica]
MNIYDNITQTVGRTPLVRIQRLAGECSGRLLAKIESFNPLSSVKDRVGVAMIEDAERSGRIRQGTTIVEPTSGNTGIALAFACAAKGYRLILTMPDTMSVERRRLLKVLGAELVLTDGAGGMKQAIAEAERLVATIPGSIMLQQFSNPANPDMHRRTTAREIWEDTAGSVDVFVAGVGTGGTITGVGSALKELSPRVQVIAVEPEDSPVISGGKPGPHKIQGIGAGFLPDNLDTTVIDEVVAVSADEAGRAARALALKEGIVSGISSGAAMSAALEIASRPSMQDKNIVVLLPDTGERYLSTWLFAEE